MAEDPTRKPTGLTRWLASCPQFRKLKPTQVMHRAQDLRLWSPAGEQLLGTAADAVIARKLKRTEAEERERRNQLGLRASIPRYRRPWTADEDELLRTLPVHGLGCQLKTTCK